MVVDSSLARSHVYFVVVGIPNRPSLIRVSVSDARGAEVYTAPSVLDQLFQRKNLFSRVEGAPCGLKLFVHLFF